jgi:hypothetical protein
MRSLLPTRKLGAEAFIGNKLKEIPPKTEVLMPVTAIDAVTGIFITESAFRKIRRLV